MKRINVERELRAALRDEIPTSDKVIVEKPVPVEVPVDKPVAPPSVEDQMKKKTGLWQWLTGLFSSGALGLGWLGSGPIKLLS